MAEVFSSLFGLEGYTPLNSLQLTKLKLDQRNKKFTK